jgi:aromatic-L-amino-acid decarboxylase
MTPVRPLEPSASQMRAMGEAALAEVIRFVEDLPEAPAVDLDGALEMAARFREGAPEEGSEFGPHLDAIVEAAGKAFNTTGPGYMAFIPGGGLFAAALADFVATALNRFVNVWNAAPPLAQIEWTAVRWLCDLFGYPVGARGILTTGGSLSNFSAIVAARRALLGEDFNHAGLYLTDQTHASVAKAALLAGLPGRAVRTVPTLPDLSMDPEALAGEVKQDRDAGIRPFLVVASAGTTNTGAVDALDRVGAVCREHGLWLHVDGAYGGPFQLTDRGKRLFRGIDQADSITLDPHKAMFLPYGTGALLVRDGERLREAHHVGADYLQDLGAEEEIPNFSEYSPELSRDFRGLRLWLPIKLHGLAAFREALDEKLDLARYLYEELLQVPELEMPWEPRLTVVAFRLRGDEDAGTARMLERINASRRVFLSSTRLGGRFTIRACIVSHRTHRDRVEEAAHIIRDAARETAG